MSVDKLPHAGNWQRSAILAQIAKTDAALIDLQRLGQECDAADGFCITCATAGGCRLHDAREQPLNDDVKLNHGGDNA